MKKNKKKINLTLDKESDDESEKQFDKKYNNNSDDNDFLKNFKVKKASTSKKFHSEDNKTIENKLKRKNDDNNDLALEESVKNINWDNVNGKRKKLNCQYLIYTIPHINDIDLKDYFEKTVDKIGDDVEKLTVSKEPHKINNYYHIHHFIKYPKRKNLYTNTLDDLGKHGNLRIMKKGNVKRNEFNMISYVIKEGEYLDYPEDWDSKLFIEQNKIVDKKTNIIAKGIMEGKYKDRLDVANDGYEGTAMIYGKHIDEFAKIIENKKEFTKKKDIIWKELEITYQWGNEWYQIITYLNFYIKKPDNNKGRIMHLFIHGETGLGKTTRLLDPLSELLNVYRISKDNIQNITWKNSQYDLCIIDEFSGQKDIVFMNEFLGSKNMMIRVPVINIILIFREEVMIKKQK